MSANPNLFIYDRDLNVTGVIPGTFTHIPSYGSSVSFDAKNVMYESSDNYFFVSPAGVNHLRPKFSLKFSNRKEDDAREIVGFMENLRGTESFQYTDATNIYAPIDVTCTKIEHEILPNNVANVSLDLESDSYASTLKWKSELISASSNNIKGNWVSGGTYSKFDVVYDNTANGDRAGGAGNRSDRFYYCKADVSGSTTAPNADSTHWASEFFFEPTNPMTIMKETSVIKHEFRKSFSVKGDFGFHANALRDFEVSFTNIKNNETRAILHYLINRQGHKRFKFAPNSFYNQNKVFIATSWNHSFVHHDVNTITVKMREDPLGYVI